MSKIKLPFSVPQIDFVPAEFVTTSEVDGVPPKPGRDEDICMCGDCEDCRERVRQFRRDTVQVRLEWQKARKKKMREMGIDE